MMLTKTLLQKILQFCADSGITERQFGLTVANNHKLVSRLKNGFGVNSQTHDRIMAFIESGRAPEPAPAAPPPIAASPAKPKTKRSAAAEKPTRAAKLAPTPKREPKQSAHHIRRPTKN